MRGSGTQLHYDVDGGVWCTYEINKFQKCINLFIMNSCWCALNIYKTSNKGLLLLKRRGAAEDL